jgi:oxidase EvaA
VLSALRYTGLPGLKGSADLSPDLAIRLQSETCDEALHSLDHLISWFTDLKTHYDLEVTKIPLQEVDEWCFTDERIHHRDNRYFEVLPVKVYIENREVSTWDQPMVRPCTEGICAFFLKMIGGIPHLLVQAKVECGCFDTLEMAPTIQCLTGSYKEGYVPFVSTLEHAIEAEEGVVLDVWQSEEGGRFYKEQNRNLIIELGDDFPEQVPDQFVWMTVGQLKHFVRFNNHVNVQARSLLAQM